MSGTRLFDLIDALVSTWDTALTVPVYDGPNSDQREPAGVYVTVGAYDYAADEDPVPSTTDKEWRSVPLTVGSQDEDISVPCSITAWTGDAPNGIPDWSALRLEIAAALDAIDTATTRSVAALGLTNVMSLILNNGSLTQEFTEDGPVARFTFTVDARFLN